VAHQALAAAVMAALAVAAPQTSRCRDAPVLRAVAQTLAAYRSS
jgi:hypothetical protein